MLTRLLLILITTSLYAPYVHAQTTSNAPLTISADDTLEWDRNNQLFTANGKAKATQDGTTITAETLTANYRKNKETGNDFDIHTMTADTNVIITSEDNKAYGDKAVYDIAKETATMTGHNLKLITPEQTVTARDQFEYHVQAGKLIAVGNAKIIRPSDTIRANTLTAYLTTDAKGKRTLDRMTAEGNVIITTATEKITGAYGTYNRRTNLATITGGVTITRGPNILKGDRATVDLNTQISKIFGSKDQKDRVTGTFYPGSQKQEKPQEE